MTDNPYESPSLPPSRSGSPAVEAWKVVRAPAICLILVASLGLLIDIPVGFDNYQLAADALKRNDAAYVAGVISSSVGFTLMHLIVLLGGVSMLKLKRFQLARAAAIIAMVPLCSPVCVVGIPFGIWAIFVLSRAGVEETFE